MIRTKRKYKDEWQQELSMLYEVAAEASFLLDTPYIDGIGPGYNVAESIQRIILDNLDFPFIELGFEKISFFNSTDKKWLLEIWGEPNQHQYPQTYHRGVWTTAVCDYRKKKKERKQALRDSLS